MRFGLFSGRHMHMQAHKHTRNTQPWIYKSLVLENWDKTVFSGRVDFHASDMLGKYNVKDQTRGY